MRLYFWIKLAILAMVSASYGCVQGHGTAGKMIIYYVPFGIETLTPITSANIQERGRHCEIQATEDINRIKQVLRGAAKPPSQKFSDRRVRVKLIDPSEADDGVVAIVEKEGEVRFQMERKDRFPAEV